MKLLLIWRIVFFDGWFLRRKASVTDERERPALVDDLVSS